MAKEQLKAYMASLQWMCSWNGNQNIGPSTKPTTLQGFFVPI